MNFEIVSDSSHDLSNEFILENKIRTVSFYLTLDGENYLKDQVDIDRPELYKALRENKDLYPKTSLPGVDDYLKEFKNIAKKGKDILCFTVASRLSGSYQSANVAGDLLKDEYKDTMVYIIDSRSASLGLGVLIDTAIKLGRKKKDLEEISKVLTNMSKTTEVYIGLNTLSYLEKGGRIGKTGAAIGNLLNIKPIASFKDNDLHVEGVSRGSKNCDKKLLEILDKKIGSKAKDYHIFVIHGDSIKRAEKLKENIEDKYNISIFHEISLVSATVISHIGPGVVALGFTKKYK